MNAMPQQTDIEDFAIIGDVANVEQQIEAAAVDIEITETVAFARIGQILDSVKPLFKYDRKWGGFEGWLKSRLRRSEGWARQAIALFEAHKDAKFVVNYEHLSPTAQYEIATSSSEVKSIVEALVVDGQRVTVADVKRLKAEAKAADELAEARAKLESLQKLSEDKDFENAGEIHKLQIQIESLERGRDLARKDANTAESKASAVEKEMDERISIAVSEAAQKIEARFAARIAELSEANVVARNEVKDLRKKLEEKPAKPDETNVVRPDFAPVTEANVDDDDDYLNPEAAMGAFAGALGAMDGLNFGAEDFWKRIGKKSTHGKRTYEAVIFVNEKLGQLIKEYAGEINNG
nr:hypothetical protein [Brucella anthropi]